MTSTPEQILKRNKTKYASAEKKFKNFIEETLENEFYSIDKSVEIMVPKDTPEHVVWSIAGIYRLNGWEVTNRANAYLIFSKSCKCDDVRESRSVNPSQFEDRGSQWGDR